jgi:hypothetical protein
MTEVSKDQFYSTIGPLDVCLTITNPNDFPYTIDFKLRYGKLIGRVISEYTDGVKYNYPIITKYFLA